MTTMIHPGVYLQFGDDIPQIQEIVGTVGFTPFISERYKDNELIFTGSKSLELFGPPNKNKYTQGLYNARNYHNVSTWLYVMRILPVIDNTPILQFDDDDNCTANCDYLHPYAGQDIAYVDANATNTITVPKHKTKPVPTFSHATVGYLEEFDDDGNPVKVGGFIRYFNPLYKVPQNRESLLYLDEQLGDDARTLARTVLTDDIELRYNPLREIFTDMNHIVTNENSWIDVIVGGPGAGGICDPANGFTDKYWPGFTTNGSYYYNFNPKSDSWKPLFTVFGIGRGPWYNNIRISIVPTGKKDGTFLFQGYYYDDRLNVMISLDSQFEISFDPDSVDQFGDSNYIGILINEKSNYINVHINGANVEFARNNIAPNSNLTVLEQVLSWTYEYDPLVDLKPKSRLLIELRNGTWGTLYTERGTLDNTLIEASFRDALRGNFDPDVINVLKNDISVVFDVDSLVSIKESIQEMVIRRQDSFGYLDVPKSATADAAVAKRHNDLSAITSWQVGLFGVHTLVESTFEGRNIWVAPTYHLSKLVPTVDKTGEVWDAVAGLKRSVISCRKLQYNLNDTDYDRWYLAQLNPLMEKMGVKHIGGNLTAQIITGPKSNINIVRMVLYVSKTLRKFGEYFIFDNIVPSLLQNIKSQITSFLDDIKARNGIQSYSVSVNSSEYDMKRKIVRVNVTLTPIYSLEKLLISVNLTQ